MTAEIGLVVAWPLAATLGEGPVWVAREQTLWFTDIKQRRIHRFDPRTGEKTSWRSPEQIGFIQPTRDGGFIAGLQSGLARFDPADGNFVPMVKVDEHRPGNRLNDSVVDPAGRLWFGTMDDGEREDSGAMHRLMPDGSVLRVGGECPITNGPAVSPDGRRLYHVDTLRGVIHEFAIGIDGSLINGRTFATIDSEHGNPDGVSVDAEGCLWLGLWGGWAARRYSPDGTILATVQFPVANVTKIAFGGPGLRTAFATTARHGLDAKTLATQPLAGALFAFSVDVPGLVPAEVGVGIG